MCKFEYQLLNKRDMQVTIHTDNHIENSDRRETYFNEVINQKLKRFDDFITALEVHVTDENSKDRTGNADIRCQIEARINGKSPLSATCHADTVEKAIGGCIEKIKHALEHTYDKMRSH
ncbi:Sigma 54 modulation protein / S30EA ribosomal protein [Flavobacterium akiainvivens]|nr:Sigma 54 modulation protein / S30EA ribosomal protein [Flavobacterium akiainvivens]